jgi:hypothetical protein
VKIKDIIEVYGRSNVYTNPLTNPQRNPNVDSKRTEPLTVMEIEGIKEVNQQYPERYKSQEIDEKVKFYEKTQPHVMYHADTMEIMPGNGSLITKSLLKTTTREAPWLFAYSRRSFPFSLY